MSPTAALLLLLAACIADRPPQACDPADTTVPAETAETGDSGSVVVPGLDRSAEMTACGPWSGVPDVTTIVASYELAGTRPEFTGTERTMLWMDLPGGTSGSTVGELLGHASLSWSGVPHLATRRREFHCDDEGLWLDLERWEWWRSASDGTLDDVGLFAFVECSSSPLLVIPRELELGTKWDVSCSGTYAMSGGGYVVEFACSYEVDEARDYTTPAGTFAARHVSVSGDFCRNILDDLTWFSGPDGYWVGRGVGVLHSNSPQWPDLTLTEVH